MTEPMALDAKALEEAARLTREQTFSALTIDEHRLLIRDAIRAYLATLPPPATEAAWTPEKYAEQLAVSIRQRCYPEVPQFEPMTGDIMGLLSQIDNMLAGMVRAGAQQRRTALPNPLGNLRGDGRRTQRAHGRQAPASQDGGSRVG